jgi:hypothetical protein
MQKEPVVEKNTTYVALDDSKRKIVAGILRPGAPQPELLELPNDPHHIRRLFERLTREGPVMVCYEAGSRATTSIGLYVSFARIGDDPSRSRSQPRQLIVAPAVRRLQNAC